MAQHFLLSRDSRDISLRAIFALSAQEVRDRFAELRWGSKTEQTCPHCGSIRSHRYVRVQKRWRCRECYAAFSVTSGTVFNGHKLPLQVILAGIVLYVNAVKGISALQMSRDLDVQYKTAFVLLHKLRETLWLTRETDLMGGEVEIDGGYVHTYVRPENKKKDRKNRVLSENQNPQKCVMLVIRERGSKPKEGAKRTRTFILKSENQSDIMAIVRANVHPGAIIFTDEASGYSTLSAGWEHHVVNHSQEYRADDGANENQAESYISRFRRMMMGQIHRLKRIYLDVYANEVACREDRRRTSNGSFVTDIVIKCLATGQSRDWTGYWQGNHRTFDSVIKPA
jgi:transposase-like protein